MSKSSKAETSPIATVQSAGATFFIGDFDAQEKQEASAGDPAAYAPARTTNSEVLLKDSKMKEINQHLKMIVQVSLLMTSAPHKMTHLRLKNRAESAWAVPQM